MLHPPAPNQPADFPFLSNHATQTCLMHDPQSPLPASYAQFLPRPLPPNEAANYPFRVNHASRTSLMHEPGAPAHLPTRLLGLPASSAQTVSSSSTMRPRRSPRMTLKASILRPRHQTSPRFLMNHASHTSLMHGPGGPAHLPTRLLGPLINHATQTFSTHDPQSPASRGPRGNRDPTVTQLPSGTQPALRVLRATLDCRARPFSVHSRQPPPPHPLSHFIRKFNCSLACRLASVICEVQKYQATTATELGTAPWIWHRRMSNVF